MEIKIGKSAHACSACGRDFEHDQEFHSLVRVHEQALVREDHCADCWDENIVSSAYSSWTPRYYDPKVAEAGPPEVFSPLRQVFYGAAENKERLELSVAFLAAQMLRRQKVFRLIKEGDEPESEGRVALFTDRIGNRLIEVHDPHLAHAELEEGRNLLIERLSVIESEDEKESGDDGEQAAD